MTYKADQPNVRDTPNLSVTLDSKSPLLLGRCSRQLRRSCADASMVCSRAEYVLIFEYYFGPHAKVTALLQEFFGKKTNHEI
jgi:hypothetical protein